MSWERSKLLAAVGRWGFVMRAAFLAAGLSILFALLAPLGYQISGPDGATAAGLAALLCFVGGLLGLAVGQFFSDPRGALFGMLAGMLLRAGVPLAVGLVIHLRNATMAQAGLLFYLLACYLVALAMETLLAVAQAQSNTRSLESR